MSLWILFHWIKTSPKLVAGKSFDKNEIGNSHKNTNTIKQYFANKQALLLGLVLSMAPH